MNKYKIIDGHQDIAFNAIQVTGKDFLKENSVSESQLLPEPQLNQSDYVRLSNSGVRLVFGVCFPYKLNENEAYTDKNFAQKEMHTQLDFYNNLEVRSSDKIKIIKSKSDLGQVLNTEGILGLVLLAEDAIGIDVELKNLQEFYDKGLRMIGIVWNRDTEFAGGTDSINGLTKKGKNLLEKMDELNMILDTAHMNPTVFMQALEIFKGCVMNSHTCVSFLNAHRRNLNDEQLKMIASRGGVVGVAFVPEFLNIDELKASVDDVVAHIKHAVDVCGIEHVGLGSDFDGMSWPEYVPNLAHTGEYINLIKKLEEIYSKEEVEKIIYTNWKTFLENSL